MPEHYHTRRGKLLSCYPRPVMRLAQDMHNPNTAMAYYNLAFDRQLQHDLFIFNIALYSYHGRNGLQFAKDGENREITGMNDQFDACEMLPDGFRQPLEVRDMGI